MFEGFDAKKDATARKRWFASAGTSAVVYLTLGSIVAYAAGKTVIKRPPEEIDVTFRADVEPPPPDLAPPPPPPPPPRVKSASARKPGRPLMEPTRVSDERAEDVADGAAIDPDAIGDGEVGKPAPPAPPPPPPEPVKIPEPVDVPDDFELAAPLEGNRMPEYPLEARRKGVEAEVVVKLSISASGEVTDVSVIKGADPFLAATLAVVRTWRYRPAREAGRPISGTRIVRIPFRIRV
jgi:protein TonB